MIDFILLFSLLLIPIASGAVCFTRVDAESVMRSIRFGAWAFAITAVLAICATNARGALYAAGGLFFLDALSSFHLVVLTSVFWLSTAYLQGYFSAESDEELSLSESRRFGALWFGAMAAMTLVLISNNIGIMWVGIEATTLVTAFLICTHRTPVSMEATWKYLIVCSVGVAFAFMGTLFAGAAASKLHLPVSETLLWTQLRLNAASLDPMLLKTAFVFLLVGYGTKAGLAPMHSWLPDAHSQAPAPVSALFSGFMLNAALYCIMRYIPIVEISTNHSGWALRLMLCFGLISILTAASLILAQRDLKRLLAYCSVEHIGVIAVGLGLGGIGIFAALFHTLNHSLAKSLAFFAAGRLGQMHGSHDMNKMTGASRFAPIWGKGLFLSLLALMGAAPFALFMSEFLVVRAAAAKSSWWSLGFFLFGLAVVFIGMLRRAISIAWGEPISEPTPESASGRDKALVFGTLFVLLLLGLWTPGFLTNMLNAAAGVVEGSR